MKICSKEGCSNIVPKFFVDENGKKHNCQRRKFCFDCSSYGSHNTKNINNVNNTGECLRCGSPTQKGTRKTKCFKCFFNERKQQISNKIYTIIGYKCWRCGYDKGREGQAILDFHHIDPSKKLFGLSTREFVGKKWNSVWEEIKKCVSLCCRCHREYHSHLISDQEILDIYVKEWDRILKR